jgi:magnesium transporter
MRLFHLDAAHIAEWPRLPESLPPSGYCWFAFSRREFELLQGVVQGLLAHQGNAPVHELHWQDLLNNQLPSHHDASSGYSVMVFRRLAPGRSEKDISSPGAILHRSRGLTGPEILSRIDTSPIGFLLFDRIVISVHPADCAIRDQYIQKISVGVDLQHPYASSHLPANPPELMLRLLSTVVDGYLDLRRELTRQLDQWQKHLLNPNNRFSNWSGLLDSRMTLHHLDEICEDQRAALQGWMQSLEAWTADERFPAREIEHLKVRSRDLLEHVERVVHHVNRLEQSTETTMQLHFNVQGNRTNDIMRTLTVLTAIFLPLNLITGFFGMNFESFDFIHRQDGLLLTECLMLVVALVLGLVFWKKRYLGGD